VGASNFFGDLFVMTFFAILPMHDRIGFKKIRGGGVDP